MIAKLNSKKFLFSSTLALGVLTGVGITAAPAQAAGFTQTSTLEWDNGTSNFRDDAATTFDPADVDDTFNVTFSPASITGEAAVFAASGDFAPYFNLGSVYTVNGGLGATETFIIDKASIITVGSAIEAEFTLDNDLQFIFEPVDVPGASVTATLPQFQQNGDPTKFLGELIQDGSVEFELEEGEWEFVINDPGLGADPIIEGTAASSVMEFGQDAFSTVGGNYGADGTVVVVANGVPEPASILGLLAVGGLGLGLKRKKQSKQLPV